MAVSHKTEGAIYPGIPGNEIRIVLLGKTGAGKSSTGNTILDNKAFKCKAGFKSVTDQCDADEEERFEKRILVVDTPGFFDTTMTKEVFSEEISDCIGFSAPGPHAFLIVIKMERFTSEEKNSIREIEKVFGEQFYKYAIVVFTRKDEIGDDQTIAECISEIDGYMKDLLEKCGNRYIALNNRADQIEKDEVVKHLLDMIEQVLLENGGSFYSNEMYKKAEEDTQRMIQQRMKEEQNLKEKTKIQCEKEYRNRARKRKTYWKKVIGVTVTAALSVVTTAALSVVIIARKLR